MRRSFAAILFACIAAFAASAGAQQSIIVGGVVVSAASGQSLPFATVSVSNGVERFTDADGSFSVSLAPGQYHLRIRQLGYATLDTLIPVRSGVDFHALSFALTPIAIKLAAIQAFANFCRAGENPGDLAGLLGELTKNAEREKLLRNQYPFFYDLQRSTSLQSANGTQRQKTDTARFNSTVAGWYKPGALVHPVDSAAPNGPREMRFPELIDLADPAFLASHCFRYRGVEKIAGAPAYRIDFQPSSGLQGADVEGSAFIDSSSYLIRESVFRLTKPEKLDPPILGLEVTTTYHEVFNGITLFERIKSAQPLTRDSRSPLQTQDQRLIAVRFYGRTPDGVEIADSTTKPAAVATTVSPPSLAPSTISPQATAPKRVSDSTASLAGIVVDSGGHPLRGADIRTADGALRTVSGDSGQFALHGLKPGKANVMVRVLGYGPATFSTSLRAGKTHRVRVVLTPATVQLSTVVVLDSISDPLLAQTGFFQRKKTGWGTFISPDEIKRRNAGRASDYLRMVSGVDVANAGRFGTLPVSRRAMSFSGRCLMSVYIDGNQVTVNRSVPLEDVISGTEIGAMEVYPSASETPQEFTGIGAASPCGAVVIWTKEWLSQEADADSTKHL